MAKEPTRSSKVAGSMSAAAPRRKPSSTPKKKFTAHIIIDLAKRVVILEVDKTRLEQKLPEGIEKVSYIGLYSKATSSDFSAIEVTK
ncbi:MAG: hypothetical protein H8E96_02080 [Verrucomicrobiaceae bacterium]|nr:hypothetical protein [Verrucomicrobiaceae bacterium]